MNLYKIIFCFLALNSFFVFGQWNVQLGHEYGVSKVVYHSTPQGEDDENNQLHRFKIVGEYQFNNGFIVALNSGVDWHVIDYEYNTESTISGFPSTVSRNIIGTIQNYRVGFSVGYLFNISENSKIGLNLGYDQFFVNKVLIKESNYTTNIYTGSDSEPHISSQEFQPLINLEEIGYQNKLRKKNKNLVFSLSYRFKMANFFISPSIVYSPFSRLLWSNPAVIPKSQHIYLFGLNIGYTFPQKNNYNEK